MIQKKHRKIVLPLKTRLGTWKHGAIYIPSEFRKYFPHYKQDFIMSTDIADFTTWVTSKSKAFPDGCNIQGGLLPWFRNHKPSSKDSFVIEVLQPLKKYKLSLQKNLTVNKATAQKSYSGFFEGDKLYLKSAKKALPYLVRQAIAGEPIFYSTLADEIGMPNPRNLNYVLGAIGNALIDLGKKFKTEIPPIQCLVLNKQTKLPGEGVGWFISSSDFSKLSLKQKRELVDLKLAFIFSYQKWDWVLNQFQLEPIGNDLKSDLKKVKKLKFKGGESSSHKRFKNYVAANPSCLGLPHNISHGVTEYILPSADKVDVVFKQDELIIGVEVKSEISSDLDILRGLFQCVKYKYLIEAEQVVNNALPRSRVILALESKLPSDYKLVKNILNIEVIENIKVKE